MGRMGWLAAAAMAVLLPVAAAKTASGEIKVGVVDTVDVLEGYQRIKDAARDLDAERADLKALADQKFKRVDDLRLRRDGFNKGTEEWNRLDDEALKAEVEVRTSLAFEQAKLERRHRDNLLDTYHEMVNRIAQIAKEKGLDLVFTKSFLAPPTIDLGAPLESGLEDLKSRIVGQRLIYPTNITDITQEVIKALNAQYKPARKPTEPGPAKTPTPAKAPAVAPGMMVVPQVPRD